MKKKQHYNKSKRSVGHLDRALPKRFAKYFWDCDIKDLNWGKYPFFMAERMLHFGNVDSVKWLIGVAGPKYIMLVVKKSRSLDAKSKSFWRALYGK